MIFAHADWMKFVKHQRTRNALTHSDRHQQQMVHPEEGRVALK